MSRIAYVDGRYVVHARARVAIEDRGYQFADGVYEVLEVYRGSLIDERLHLDRLQRSLQALMIAPPLTDAAFALVLREVVARNRVRDGLVYLQVTRGVASRDHLFPDPPVRPVLVITARSLDTAKAWAKAQKGVSVVTMPDLRWKRPDIKSISLLPNVLAKQEAKARGAAEAWLVDPDGFITEGASSNAWIVTADARVVTHAADGQILKGVTRTRLLDLIAARDLTLEERPFSVDEAHAALEAFLTGATNLVMPIVAIDGCPVGNGRPGSIAGDLRQAFRDAAPRSQPHARQNSDTRHLRRSPQSP